MAQPPENLSWTCSLVDIHWKPEIVLVPEVGEGGLPSLHSSSMGEHAGAMVADDHPSGGRPAPCAGESRLQVTWLTCRCRLAECHVDGLSAHDNLYDLDATSTMVPSPLGVDICISTLLLAILHNVDDMSHEELLDR